MQTSFDNQPIYAGFFSRLAAFLLDHLIVAVALLIVKIPIGFIQLMVGDVFLFRPVLFQFTVFDIFYYHCLLFFVLMH